MKDLQIRGKSLLNGVRSVLVVTALPLVVVACSGAPSTFEKSIVSSLTKVGFISPDGPSHAIDYSPRAPLVLPPTDALDQPILPPEDVKLSPRKLARLYYPDQSKLTLKQYEALIAKRRALEAKGGGTRHLNPSAFSGDEEDRIRYQRQARLTYPRAKYFKKVPVPGASVQVRANGEQTAGQQSQTR